MKRLIGILTSGLILVTALVAPAFAEISEPLLVSTQETIDPGKVDVQFKVRLSGAVD